MKFLKFGIFALALGFFATSCTNGTDNAAKDQNAETEQVDQATPATPATMDSTENQGDTIEQTTPPTE